MGGSSSSARTEGKKPRSVAKRGHHLQLQCSGLQQLPQGPPAPSLWDTLWLEGNAISTLGPALRLASMVNLLSLSVPHNALTTIPVQLFDLPMLQYFDGCHNRISRMDLAPCTTLKVLLLHDNLLGENANEGHTDVASGCVNTRVGGAASVPREHVLFTISRCFISLEWIDLSANHGITAAAGAKLCISTLRRCILGCNGRRQIHFETPTIPTVTDTTPAKDCVEVEASTIVTAYSPVSSPADSRGAGTSGAGGETEAPLQTKYLCGADVCAEDAFAWQQQQPYLIHLSRVNAGLSALPMSVPIPVSVVMWPSLQTLTLDGNNINALQSWIATQLPMLTRLHVSCNVIATIAREILEELPKLKYVDLSFNRLTELPLPFELHGVENAEILIGTVVVLVWGNKGLHGSLHHPSDVKARSNNDAQVAAAFTAAIQKLDYSTALSVLVSAYCSEAVATCSCDVRVWRGCVGGVDDDDTSSGLPKELRGLNVRPPITQCCHSGAGGNGGDGSGGGNDTKRPFGRAFVDRDGRIVVEVAVSVICRGPFSLVAAVLVHEVYHAQQLSKPSRSGGAHGAHGAENANTKDATSNPTPTEKCSSVRPSSARRRLSCNVASAATHPHGKELLAHGWTLAPCAMTKLPPLPQAERAAISGVIRQHASSAPPAVMMHVLKEMPWLQAVLEEEENVTVGADANATSDDLPFPTPGDVGGGVYGGGDVECSNVNMGVGAMRWAVARRMDGTSVEDSDTM